MRPANKTSKRHQCGLGIVAAIFLIMVVAILATAIVRTVRTSADTRALEVLSQHAFLVAESGAQLGVRRVYPRTGAGVCAGQTVTFTSLQYPYCDATVACAETVVQGRSFYAIESRGRCDDGGDFVAERVVEVRARS